MRRRRAQLVVLIVLCGLTRAGMASGEAADPSWLGQPGTVHAEWDAFAGPANAITPDTWSYVPPEGESPVLWEPIAEVIAPSVVHETVPGTLRTGIVEQAGDNQLVIHTPNMPDPNVEKYIFVRVWIKPVDLTPPDIQFSLNLDITTPGSSYPSKTPDDGGVIVTGDDFAAFWVLITIPENPTMEDLSFLFRAVYEGMPAPSPWYPLYIDKIVVDTWCTPEPGTAAMVVGLIVAAVGRRGHSLGR